jgi:adenylosuccinate synthase
VFNDKKYVLHTIPSGIFHENKINLIGNGVVIDPVILNKEIEKIKGEGVNISESLFISRKAHLILPTHRLIDAASEKSKGKNKIGSTLKGIGPTYMDKTGRNGFRVGDLENDNWEKKYSELSKKHQQLISFYNVELDFSLSELENEFFEAIKKLRKIKFVDSEDLLFKYQDENKSILAEGAQGSLLDIDFGTYPFVTSSNTTAAGACTGLGVSPNSINDVFGIFKAYTTRVGSGPFPTELFDNYGEKMSKVGNEFGATTGRPRRCGWLDLVALKYACRINGVTKLMMMKTDVLSGFDKVLICTNYKYRGLIIDNLPYDLSDESIEPIYQEFNGWSEDLRKLKNSDELPENLNKYIDFLEKELNIPIVIVSVGPDRKETLFR